VIYPTTVKTLPNYLFYDCDAIASIGYSSDKSVVLHENLTTIGQYTFSECDKLTYVDISKNIQTIDKAAFANNVALKEIILSEKLTTIVELAFINCTKLEKITLPISTSYGCDSFSNTPAVKAIVFLVGTGKSADLSNASSFATNYKASSPWYNKTINTITIPEGVTTLNAYFFYGAKISNFILPNTLTTIGASTFYNCTTTSDLKIPNSVKTIGSNAFYNVPHITYNGTASGRPWGALAIN
jgi:hypothetical protein